MCTHILLCLYTWNLTLAIVQEWQCLNTKKQLEKLCVFAFRCKGKIVLTFFFPSGEIIKKKNSVAKAISDPGLISM